MWIDYSRADREALSLLRANAIVKPPIDPVAIARSIGVKVVFARFASEDNNIAGYYDPRSNSITVNDDEWGLRQNFTIAHELGHKVLHEAWASSESYQMMFRDTDANNDTPYEKEANRFAAKLLVPRFLLDKFWDKFSVETLSELFAVSVPVIKNRISSEYGVLTR